MDDAKTLNSEIPFCQAEGKGLHLEVRLLNENVWLNINQMAQLFQADKSSISRHLKNIFESGELVRNSVVVKSAATAADGKTCQAEHFSLEAVISVGFRVNSLRGTQFRIWAAQKLKEFLIKGFISDGRRLKETGSSRCFEELLARIRDIRSSEKVFWRQVLDFYSASIDYDPKSAAAKMFFQQVLNKMHWAAHGRTASELIHLRADAAKPNMGVTNFPGSKLLKSDTEEAKNYLSPDELDIFNRLVNAYLDVSEILARNSRPMTMADWEERLNQFLTMIDRKLLNHAGTVSHGQALSKARNEFDKFNKMLLSAPAEA
ncbi:MAG: virulence RhuM family protein [Deltaproteobacteria bacterium]|jgi:hypothetical protein|nr:virulence RhuM family protein [Deltaproteobacteria bacterium]